MGTLCMIGATEIIVVCVLVLLLFGGKKIPELMKGLGQGVRSFKTAMNEPLPDEQQREQEWRNQQAQQQPQSQPDQTSQNESEQR
ncbi:MAG: twin-arginine translocase TatA/TatE family subunit [Bacteroidales bacterium]|nr:twin-arginine translocase TatA/TatE family subunit [Bacteroidales bacterium]